MTTALTEFFPYVQPHVPGCSEPLLEQAIRSACIDFCTRSLVIQTIVPADYTDDVQDYTVAVPANMTLVRVLGVFLKDAWLSPNTIENVRSGVALRGDAGDAVALNTTPVTYFQKLPTSTTVSLYPVPHETVTDGLAVRAAFAPSRNAGVVDTALFEDWVEDIAAGAAARLVTIPNQPFSNPAMAAGYTGVFQRAARAASIQARSGKVAASSRVQPAAFV